MPRIPYLPADISEPKDLVDAIRFRRGGSLLNLDRELLYSPPFARGWNIFLKEVREGLTLSSKLRELAICVVAVLNGAEFEFHVHGPEFIKAGGTQTQVDALRQLEIANDTDDLFDDLERATIQLTIEMTRQVNVSEATFQNIQKLLPEHQHVVELVGVIATYNMVSRFLVALDIQPDAPENRAKKIDTAWGTETLSKPAN
ncbi:MAG: carboxymuconolactone decarboxylase family protein [Pseudomonadota bacterium]